ncbi:hypothetical protein FHL15_004511 [Xylaria flabelliformis]|uniref:VWFA domain-containing protein n=1 Tax=Xylaria flabelliformis TaxID=2512241 RepID=A0A553I2Y1_9PEZI|nr:hypothetical protein FHL15_004511 [Xylaria flabelliformis]
MSKSTDQSLSPKDSSSKRSSFSFSRSIGSVRRALGSDKNTRSASSNPFAEPPPAYSETEAGDSGHNEKAPTQKAPSRVQSIYSRLRGSPSNPITSEADKFRFLAEFDTVFLIDDSSSMTWNDRGDVRFKQGELSRWEQTRNVIEQIVPVCMRYDQDGLDIYFLNDPYHMNFFEDPHRDDPGWSKEGDRDEGKASYAYIGVKNAKDVKTVFDSRQPMLNTPTGRRLGEMMETYVNCYAARDAGHQALPKPLNIIVITDGEASDKDFLRDNLIRQAERLDALSAPYHQLGVQFFQVGKDESAARHLRELDDGLGKYRRGKELRDIVDCVTYEQLSSEGGSAQLTADVILKVVLGAVNRHLDNQKIREGLLVRSS